MKKNPVKNIAAPSYPTMAQFRGNASKIPISKVAIVTALTAAMALTAGCVEEKTRHRLNGRLEAGAGKANDTSVSVDIQGEIGYTDYIDGGETCYTEPTEEILMGEAETYVDPTDYEIDGDVIAYTEPPTDATTDPTKAADPSDYILSGGVEVQTDPTDDDWDLMGDEAPYTDDVVPSET